MNLSQRIGLLVVFLALLNPVLRTSVESSITPYYLVFGFIFIWYVITLSYFRKICLWLLLLLAYGWAVGMLNGTAVDRMAFQSIKYLQLATFFGVLIYLVRSGENAAQKLYRYAFLVLIAALVIALFQQLFKFEIPTVVNEGSSRWLNAFFYTPNDLGLFLAAMVGLIISSGLRWYSKLFLIASIFVLNIRNDSKAAAIASLIVVVVSYFLLAFKKIGVRQAHALLIMLGVFFSLAGVLLSVDFIIGDTHFDFAQLFQDPFYRVLNLNPYALGGSIFDRTDSIIYNLMDFSSNYYLGLGPNGSMYTLAKPEYELLTAKSLHNALLEFFFEFGVAAVVILWVIIVPKVKETLSKSSPNRSDFVRIGFLLAMPMLSVSQSAGFISNYAFWLVAFLIWYSPVTVILPRNRKLPLRVDDSR